MSTTTIDKPQHEVTKAEPTQRGQTYLPNVDIIEKADELLLIADVPGATADGIDIQFERGTLTIHARVEPRRNDDKTGYLLREYGVGGYHRSFEVSDHIDADKMTAEVSNGVLTLHLPKAETMKPKKITVKTV